MRTLLDVDGPIETARHRVDLEVVDERKIDQVVAVLGRYKVDMAALQETKWFGDAIYRVAQSVVVAAGRPVPCAGAVRQRGEGVAIVLSGSALKAWSLGGKIWKAWSSRLVSVTLKMGHKQDRWLHVLSCYAPTYAASREEKNRFFNTLQQALSAIPPQDCYVILGDFNARVGSRVEGDEWWNERGPHGYGVLNDAGRELLSFLSINEATICNTWFMKKAIHKQTWQHPRSRQWHCIDYSIMRRAHHWRCVDITVKRGSDCNTDHRMLWMKLRTGRKPYNPSCKVDQLKRYDVTKLQGPCVDVKGRELTKGKFVTGVCDSMKGKWDQLSTAQEKWEVLKSALCDTASSIVGHAHKREADWFRDSEAELRPLFEERSKMHALWLGTGQPRDKRKFMMARRSARKAVREAKNKWFQVKAAQAMRGRNNGKVVWKCIRDIQRSRRGLVPVRTPTVKDENGNPCVTPEQQQQRWRRYFSKVLSTMSVFDAGEVDQIRQRAVREELKDPPSEEELIEAVIKLENGKAGGESGILPEMVKAACCEEEFVQMLLDLVKDVWQEGKVPDDWRDAVLVPIPKRGDLCQCDNWRGIALLDIVGKLVARVLQERLQKIAEEELPESQCGFRKGRGCTDMIFTVRQLVEKSWEHNEKLFISFVDLKKAYDSVPREAMWKVLGKLGVPDPTIYLIRSFHQDMSVKVRLGGVMTDSIEVRNGLRQGCCMAPVLFNLFMCAMMERWAERAHGNVEVGVRLHYKYDEKLFRRYERNANMRLLTECQFADDGALLASSRSGAELAIRTYQKACSNFGLTVSNSKTKHMVTGRLAEDCDRESIETDGGEIERVKEFLYLGSVMADSGRMDIDVERRISQASRAFGVLRKAVFLDKNLTLSTKRKIYQACVLSVLFYGSECWTTLKKHTKKLNTFHHRCIRTILGISNKQQWDERISSTEVRRRWGNEETVEEKIRRRRLEWLGHVARMPDNRIPKSALFGWLPQPRPPGGPRRRWKDVIRRDLKNIKVAEDVWYGEAVRSRAGWRAMCRLGIDNLAETRSQSFQREAVSREVECEVCFRKFRRESDKKRHKCLSERNKPVNQQKGAAQCQSCRKWFRSKGGMAVHTCNHPES